VGERKLFSPMASTLICGSEDAVLTDPALLQTEKTALDFFNAKLERYPNHLGRYVLWAGAQTLYGVPEHPEEDPRKISVASWL
jgi:hypothetical protein